MYEIGDSDTVDIGDRIEIGGLSEGGNREGVIEKKLNRYRSYERRCFLARMEMEYEDKDIGSPVLNMLGKVIGMVIKISSGVWKEGKEGKEGLEEGGKEGGEYVIIPVNEMKESLRAELWNEWDQKQNEEGGEIDIKFQRLKEAEENILARSRTFI